MVARFSDTTLTQIEKTCTAGAQVVAALAVAGLLLIAILTVIDITFRFFFDSPLTGLNEATGLLMALMIAATFPASILRRSQITIDLLEPALGKLWAKVGELIGALALLGLFFLLAWRFGIYAERLAARNAATMIVEIPTAPLWWSVSVMFALCMPLQCVAAARIITELRTEMKGRSLTAGSGGLIFGVVAALSAAAYAAMVFYGSAMSPDWLALVGLAALWLPLMILVPIGAAMALAGLVGIWLLTSPEAAFSTVAIQTSSFLGNSNVSVLPLFLMMGSFASVAGVSDDVYALAHAVLGRWRGGIAMATIGGCAGFGAVTGSSVATVATLGRVAIPEMKRYGYSPALTTGTVAAGGTLGPMVPPGSGPLVVFALLTEASIGQLMIASIGPAVLAVSLYLITISLYVRIWPSEAPQNAPPIPGELTAALKRSGPVAFLFGGVLGGIYSGVFTGTESAAVGAAGAFALALYRGKVRRDTFLEIVGETTITTAMIYSVIIGALIFSYFIGLSGIAIEITEAITGLQWEPFAVILLLLAVYIVLGTFMESYTVMIISVPIVTPIILGMDYDLIWWGILMLCVVETGAITPPFGINMFIAKNISNVPMSDVFRGVTPFVAADLVRITIIAAFPAISLWLVGTMFN